MPQAAVVATKRLLLAARSEAVTAAIAVDDFPAEELSPRRALGDVLSQAINRPAAAE